MAHTAEAHDKNDIIIEFEDRSHFLNVLKENPGAIIIKFGATWCRPCKKIKETVDNYFNDCPDNIICCDLDVDENIDLYAFLKTKKQVNGIPALLSYIKGNITFASNHNYSGTALDQIDYFFKQTMLDVNKLSSN